MNGIKLYSKYTDKANRKFIVVERFASFDTEKNTQTPSSVKLLDVNGETTTMVTNADFEQYLKDKLLIPVNTF